MRQGAAEKRNTHNRRVVVAFLAACIVLLVIGPRVEPVASVLSPVFVPIESVISGVSDDVGATISSLTKLPTLQKQNRMLEHRIAILQQEIAGYPIALRELRQLNRALNFSDLNPHLALVPARVDGYSAPGLAHTVTIGRGSNDGIRLENPVLDQDGFVIGKVTQVWRAGATVDLLSDPVVKIPAMDSRSGARGLADTPAGMSPRLDDVLSGQKLHSGDYVVTSGLYNEFPVGLLIGQIVKVQGGNVQSFQDATVRTAADLNNPVYVQVITNFGPGAKVNYGQGRGLP